jgi:hypothetical protein
MNTHHIQDGGTVPGIGPGAWDSAVLAREQETAAAIAFLHETKQSKDQSNAIVYRLYTEDTEHDGDSGVSRLVTRYFAGATIYAATGLWQGATEYGLVVEIVATSADLQSIIHLAGDIKVQNHQSSVLMTWAPVSRLDV